MLLDSSLALSTSARTRCLYSARKMRRLALATTSGLGGTDLVGADPGGFGLNALCGQGRRVCLRILHAEFLPALLCN